MNGLAGFLGGIHGMDQRGLLEELAILNILGDPGQFLIHDAACAHIQVAHFAIAHLAVRQAHVHAAGAQLRIRILGLQRVQMRRTLLINRIALMSRIDAEAIHNNQSRHFLIHKTKSFLAGFRPAPSRVSPCTHLRAVLAAETSNHRMGPTRFHLALICEHC